MLSEKEKSLLKDMKEQEKLFCEKCEKGEKYACDDELKKLFRNFREKEQSHYKTLCSMEQGEMPGVESKKCCENDFCKCYDTMETQEKKDDCYLASDLLTMEKHISHLFDTCLFEFRENKARDIINSMQKEEQECGKTVYDYMVKNAMYS